MTAYNYQFSSDCVVVFNILFLRYKLAANGRTQTYRFPDRTCGNIVSYLDNSIPLILKPTEKKACCRGFTRIWDHLDLWGV